MKFSRLRDIIDTGRVKFCVNRGPGIGDVLMSTPTIRAIKYYFPDSHLTYATDTTYLDGAIPKVLENNPYIDKVIAADLANPGDYDLSVNIHGVCISHEEHGKPPINRIDLFANFIDIPLVDRRPIYVATEKELAKGRDMVFHIHTGPKIFVQPSASNERRSYPHRALKEAVMDLTSRGAFCFISTHSRDWHSDVLWHNIYNSAEVKDLKVREIAGLIANCDLVLCNDSSILHLAGALDIPTVALFGPTHPDARINYYPKAVALWGGRDLAPCPCWFDNTCPLRMACWRNTLPQDIVKVCVQHLETTRK